jgi:hypothetical protein
MSEPKLVYEREGEYAAIPWAIRLDTGRILLAFRIATHHMIDAANGRVVTMYSDDSGRTWSEPVVVCDHFMVDDREPAMVQMPDSQVWMTVMGQRKRDWPYTSYLLSSPHRGTSWATPRDFEWGVVRQPFLHHDGNGLLIAGGLGSPSEPPKDRRQHLYPRALFHIGDGPGGFSCWMTTYAHLGYADEWMVVSTPSGKQPYYIVMRDTEYNPGQEWIRGMWGFDPDERAKDILWHGARPSRPFVIKLSDDRLMVAVDRRDARVTVGRIGDGDEWGDEIVLVEKGPWSDGGTDFGYPALVEITVPDLERPLGDSFLSQGRKQRCQFYENKHKLLVFFYGYVGRDKDRGIWMQEVEL